MNYGNCIKSQTKLEIQFVMHVGSLQIFKSMFLQIHTVILAGDKSYFYSVKIYDGDEAQCPEFHVDQ